MRTRHRPRQYCRITGPTLLLLTVLGTGCERERKPTAPGSTDQPALGVRAATAPLPFREVSAGAFHTCGLTTTNIAFCWGNNPFGQLGDGTTTNRTKPVLVAGGLQFRSISA